VAAERARLFGVVECKRDIVQKGHCAQAVQLCIEVERMAMRIPVLMDTQFGDVVRQFGATTAPTTSSNCG
jgi:hypothetical protein